MYPLTPGQDNVPQMPYMKVLEWGFTPKMLENIEANITLQKAGYLSDETEEGLGHDNTIRSTDIDWIDTRMYPDFYETLSKVVHYTNASFFKYAITDIEPCQYGVYDADKKGHYATHTDGMFKGPNGTVRKISFSILLTDPKEFEGGDLLLQPDFKGIETDLQKYEICFFPSWLPHKVTPVTKGVRKSIVGWVHGPDFV